MVKTHAQIKTKSRLVLRRNDQILLECRVDEAGLPFFRPIGGNIEFGESSHSAVIREFYEETHMHVHSLVFLGCAEEILSTSEGIYHEICFLYEGVVREDQIYKVESIAIQEDVRRYTAYWKNIGEFTGDKADYLRPTNLLSFIQR